MTEENKVLESFFQQWQSADNELEAPAFEELTQPRKDANKTSPWSWYVGVAAALWIILSVLIYSPSAEEEPSFIVDGPLDMEETLPTDGLVLWQQGIMEWSAETDPLLEGF